ncbi:hypothetical protein [Neodiprion abietis nucleopolyhedrovirus]|uniref:Uncharacterized protein n=1 Tax=Neodiprion abietis nucleopolyhedrovirus TaxID=204507 RepID=Q0ZP52_9CBAC|nr:hypothetical protein [Neodiprion abietis nucleopolyhedrovirus]ABC74902.1 unknown [Neodiprion abietis nucleopolyhedrovirus]
MKLSTILICIIVFCFNKTKCVFGTIDMGKTFTVVTNLAGSQHVSNHIRLLDCIVFRFTFVR